MGESGFLDFVPFALSGVGRLGAYFLLFLFLHPWVLDGRSVFLTFWAFALPWFGLEGVHFLIFGLFHSLGFGGQECIS